MIDKQFSNTVAAAQSAKELDAIASNLLQELSKYSLPDALSNTGLRFSQDEKTRYGFMRMARAYILVLITCG